MMNNDKFLVLDVNIDDNVYTEIVCINDNFIGKVNIEHKDKLSSYISRLYVSEKYRRMGYGTKLLKMCHKQALISKCKTISLMVKSDNETVINFYKNYGFKFAYQYENTKDYLMIIELKGN